MIRVDEAIGIIEECRGIHLQYAEWQEATPDWQEQTPAGNVGGPEHHREWIAKYDAVLSVLRSLE